MNIDFRPTAFHPKSIFEEPAVVQRKYKPQSDGEDVAQIEEEI